MALKLLFKNTNDNGIRSVLYFFENESKLKKISKVVKKVKLSNEIFIGVSKI